MRPTRPILRTSAAAAVVVLTLTSCSPSGDEPSSPQTTPPPVTGTADITDPTAPPAAPSDVPLQSPSEGAGDVGLDTEAPDAPPLPQPVWDEASAFSALEAATATVEAFVRTDLEPEAWNAELAPHVTPDLLALLTGIDPTTIGSTTVTGPATLDGEVTSPFVARVLVPTDGGGFLVILTRAADGSTWEAASIDPPA